MELHGHYTQQQAIAPLVDLVYDFALPPLLLHALGTGDVDRLLHWLRIRPGNTITVLDTHDGIGVIDAGPAGERPGLLDLAEMAAIFDRAAQATNGESAAASRIPTWATVPHQINSTFLSVLGGDATAYLLARAVQLFTPGRPQIYYVGLLGGRNDMERYARTGEGREVNRHHYPAEEVTAALASEVTRAQLALVALRNTHPAFDGEFAVSAPAASRLTLTWTAGPARVELLVDVTPGQPAFRLDLGGGQVVTSVAELAAWPGDGR